MGSQILMTFNTSNLREDDPTLNPSDFIVKFNPPIRLPGRNFRLAFYSFFGWRSYHNITGKTIVYGIDGTEYTLSIPDGLYGLNEVNALLQADIVSNGGEADKLVLTPNFNTNRTEISIDNTSNTYNLDFSASNNLANFFGFSEINVTSSQAGSVIANVNQDRENLNIECDLIKGNIKNGRFSRIIHSFKPSGPTNSSMEIFPLHQTWHQIDKTFIDRIEFKVTDNVGRIVSFKGEDLTISIVLEEINK